MPTVGKIFVCYQECANEHDRHAVAVYGDGDSNDVFLWIAYVGLAAGGPELLISIEAADLQCLHYKTMVVQNVLHFEHASFFSSGFSYYLKVAAPIPSRHAE